MESRYVCKFMDVPYQNNDASNNYPVIRYADVILMYAEALNQNGKTAEACKYLNMTRRRGFGYQTTETSPGRPADNRQGSVRSDGRTGAPRGTGIRKPSLV